MVVPENVNDNEEELFIQLRNKFLQEISDSSDLYEAEDIERIRRDDSYCKRFILHKKGNFNEAYAMLKEALAWRKTFGAKDCTEESIPLEFFEAKAVFPYNQDKEGNPNILILVRYHRKNAEFAKELRRFVIYWVEKMEAECEGKQMTVVMSCTDAGLSNLDLDLIKFLITLFRSYYPHSLAHILIFEMPWIFNAAWKIIKSWLPEDFVEKIVFVNKTSILDFVSKENLPLEMGGECTTEYEPPIRGQDVNSNSIAENSREGKRVHFTQNGQVQNGMISSQRKIASRDSSHLLITDDYCILASMLKISPAQDLVFQPPGVKPETTEVVIKLTCVSEKAVTYKVKTNNIENYRVKPSIGVIEPNASIEVFVYLVQGHKPMSSDKFLIMAMELLPDSSLSTLSLSHLWRTTSSNIMADHKLKCVFASPELTVQEAKMDKAIQDINSSLTNLKSKVEYLESCQQSSSRTQKASLYLLIFLGLSIWGQVLFANSATFLDVVNGMF